MPDRFEDDRGVIQDLFGGKPVTATYITTNRGCVRGNHLHKLTTQWTFVTVGSLLVAKADRELVVEPGTMITHPPGEPHAWKALEDTGCLVFTRGPRSGQGYEADTHRLAKALLE